jgi:hypothetical protein
MNRSKSVSADLASFGGYDWRIISPHKIGTTCTIPNPPQQRLAEQLKVTVCSDQEGTVARQNQEILE